MFHKSFPRARERQRTIRLIAYYVLFAVLSLSLRSLLGFWGAVAVAASVAVALTLLVPWAWRRRGGRGNEPQRRPRHSSTDRFVGAERRARNSGQEAQR
jgi:hypothetical protein